MSKTNLVSFRATPEELAEIERVCRGLKISKSDYLRAVAFGGAPAQPQQLVPASTAPAFDDSRLSALESDVAEMRDALRQSAGAFDTLLSQLNQILRVPTFTEYRARLHAEGVEKRENETDEQFLLRSAQRYFLTHGAWPDPSNSRTFGRLPAGYDAARFPKSPPR